MKKKNNWRQFEDPRGHMGLHLPCGEMIEDGLFTSRSSTIFFSIVAFVNVVTGEVKIFRKDYAEKIGINNLKLD